MIRRDLILGTAGHIDHGKTAVVRALTGIDTDRLPEEKQRGITIDLGFAPLDLGDVQVGIVDVPGHERFIKNMLAGATGIDLALLVVAADDSVMPQTREHLEILDLLGLRTGVIALTKCDLADPAWLDLVEDEVRSLVRGTFLADAPIVRTSAATGQGIDALKAVLRSAAAAAPPRSDPGLFRLAIDRSFAVQGHGTVATGSVWSGTLRVGEEIDCLPAGRRVRARGLHHHDHAVERIEPGQRAAINLAGLHHTEVVRGHELATPGYLEPSRVWTVDLKVLHDSPWAVRHRMRVRLHAGTAETMAAVILLDGDRLEPGQSGPAQMFLREPMVCTWSQPFVIRMESPLVTLGGGRVLQPAARPIRRRQTGAVAGLADLRGPAEQRAAAAIRAHGVRSWTPLDLCRDAGLARSSVPSIVEGLQAGGVLIDLGAGTRRSLWIHRDVLGQWADRARHILARFHREFPLLGGMNRQTLLSRLAPDAASQPIAQAILDRLVSSGELRGDDRLVAQAGHRPNLSQAEQRLKAQIVETFQAAGFQPPECEALQKQATARASAVPALIALCVAEGSLVAVGDGLYLAGEAEAELRRRVTERLSAPPPPGSPAGLTVSEIREMLGTSRKYAVPFCEYLDRIGLTRREGDRRVLVKPGLEA